MKMNDFGISPVLGTVLIVCVVISATTITMMWGEPYIQNTCLTSASTSTISQIGTFDEAIDNIVYNEEGATSVTNIGLTKGSSIKTGEKNRVSIMYSTDKNYDFKVTGLDKLDEGDTDSDEFTLEMIDLGDPARALTRAEVYWTEDSLPCFLQGTKVLMSDNSFKNIEDIVAGDKIKAFDFETNDFVVCMVSNVLHHPVEKMVEGYLVINDDLCVTPNHRVYSDNSWVFAGDLKTGDVLFDGEKDVETYSIYKVFEKQPSYDLEVERLHNYFVKINDDVVLVHNEDFIEITYPAGGEEIEQGDVYTIRWTYSGPDEEIKLIQHSSTGDIYNNSGPVSMQVPTMAVDGQYEWKIPGDLSTGTYQIYIETKPSELSDTSESFQIVEGHPELYHTPKSIDFGNVAQGETISTNDLGICLEVYNSGTGMLYFTAWETESWISSLIFSQDYVDHGCVRITFNVDTGSLAVGQTYTGKIYIENTLTNEVYECKVTVTVLPGPTFNRSPKSASFLIESGETPRTSFKIWNSGAGTIEYTLSETADWIELSTKKGNCTTEKDVITIYIVNTSTGYLSCGFYSEDIMITHDATSPSSPVTFTVSLCSESITVTNTPGSSGAEDLLEWRVGAQETINWECNPSWNPDGKQVNLKLYEGDRQDFSLTPILDINQNPVDATTDPANPTNQYLWNIYDFDLRTRDDYFIEVSDSLGNGYLGRSNYFRIRGIEGLENHEQIDLSASPITPGNTGTLQLPSGTFTGTFRIELWDDNAGLNKPFGIIQVYDSYSIDCRIVTSEQTSDIILQNGAIVYYKGTTSTLKNPPNMDFTSTNFGIRITQMMEETNSYVEVQGANGGNSRAMLYANHYRSYNNRENTKTFNIRLQHYGNNYDAFHDYFQNNYDFSEDDDNTLIYNPSVSTVEGIGFVVTQSIVKFRIS